MQPESHAHASADGAQVVERVRRAVEVQEISHALLLVLVEQPRDHHREAVRVPREVTRHQAAAHLA